MTKKAQLVGFNTLRVVPIIDKFYFGPMIEITACTTADLSTLKALALSTFVNSFGHQNTPENMAIYTSKAFSDENVQQELSNPDSQFYFAKSQGEAIGYMKVNFGAAQTDLKEATGMEIERIYIRASFQGNGVGAQLFDFAEELASASKMIYIWLGVWNQNERAIRFYEKQGFKAFDTHVFYLGNDRQSDVLMRKELGA